MEMTKEALTLDNLTTGYIGKTVSKGISWQIPYGKLVSLLGANGSGKSTLLRAISLGHEVRGGKVLIDGEDLSQKSISARSRMVSVVLNDQSYERRLTVEELVAIGRIPYTGFMGVLQRADKVAIHEAIVQCRLRGYEHRRLSTLSDGERQRAFVARAIAQETPLILLDEPTAHLDMAHRLSLYQLLRDMAHHSRRVIVVSSHELQLAFNTSDEIGILTQDGGLIHGLPEQLALQHSYEQLFPDENFTYDPIKGIIREDASVRRAIQLVGEPSCDRMLCTEALLHRLGYAPTKKQIDEMRLEVTESGWMIISEGREYAYATLTEIADHLGKATIR